MGEETFSVASKFWTRPEGKAGIVVPVVALLAVIYFFGSVIGNFVVNAVDNMLHLAVVGTALIGFLWVLTDAKLRALVFYLYRSIMRWVTGQFINLDPIGVLKTYRDRLSGKLADMDKSIGDLDAQRIKVERIVSKNATAIDGALRLVEQATRKNDDRTKNLEGRQAARLSDQNKRLDGDSNRIRFLLVVLNRYRQLSADTIMDMDREIQSRQVERDYSKSSRNVVRNATAILRGLPEKDMWDEGLEALERQYSQAIGEVDHFLDITKDILSKADLQDGADADRAMKMLEEWQNKNSSVMFGGEGASVSKKDIISDAKATMAKQIEAPPAAITDISSQKRKEIA